MKKINFQNGITPLNDTNLNQMQDNMEEAGVIVSPTEPTTNEKVWIQKGKNLFRDSLVLACANCTYNNGTVRQTNADNHEYIAFKIAAYDENMNYKELLADVQTIYSTHRVMFTFTKRYYWSMLLFGLNGATTDTLVAVNCAGLIDGQTYTLSFDVTNITQGSISWENIQIEQGSTATEYEAYIEKKIYVKNNSVFEEFINAEGMLTIYEGSLKGGESVVLSNVKRFLDIYFHLGFVGDNDEIVKYVIDTGVPANSVSSGAIMPAFDNENGLEYYISESKYDKSNNTFTHTKTGYFNIQTGTYNSRNGGTGGYEIYRIDTYDN